MEILTEKIDLNNLDKSNWETFKFDEIAQKISKTIDPNETTLETYIGLEHIDAGDLHIRRKGSPDDVKGGKLRCYPGDIIFGKRRAYQRKAAIVDFDGICSAHAFVLRANSEVIDSKLFPFFLHSDQFMHRMVDISVGGLSPTINWGDLKHQEFLLPPKDQQAQLAKLLWAMDEIIEREKEVLGSVELKIKSTQKMLFSKVNYPRIKLNKYSTILGGYAFSSKSFINEGVPVIKIKNIVKGEILVDDDSNYITPDVLNLDKYVLSQGDILIAMTGATLGKIGVVQNKYDGAFLNQRVGKFQMKKGIDRWFMKGVLDSEYFLNELNKYIGEGAQGNISSEDVSKTLVPNLSESEMSDFGQKFESLYNSIKSLGNKISSSKSLQKSLINQIF